MLKKNGIKVRWSKNLKGKMPKLGFLQARVGQLAFGLIRDRVEGSGKLHDGSRLPKYAEGWFIVPFSDSRFKGGEPTRLVMGENGPAYSDKVASRLFRGGYAEAKAAAGGKGRRSDGSLTGDMWKHGRVTIGVRSKTGLTIAIGFIGSTTIARFKVPHSSNLKTRKVKYKTKKVTVTNQQKADALQRRKPRGDRTRKAQFQLMGLTDGEFARVMEAYAKGIQWFG